MRECAICLYMSCDPKSASGAVGLNTAIPELVSGALERLDPGGAEAHIMLAVCPEHVVDIYRERVDGVRMAWRLPVGSLR
jgi:hypothetical protein